MESNDSWGRKNLLNLRDKQQPHVYHKIGNGKNIAVWYDKWCSQGPLCRFISKIEVYDARLKDSATIN